MTGKSDFNVIEAKVITMQIEQTKNRVAQLCELPAINKPCSVRVRASGQGGF